MILYYTGTGNSRYAAELLGHRLNDTVRDCTPFMQGGKPQWNGHCTHCMACISYCPKAAIAYGKKSRTRRIYTCPPYRPADR